MKVEFKISGFGGRPLWDSEKRISKAMREDNFFPPELGDAQEQVLELIANYIDHLRSTHPNSKWSAFSVE